MAVTAPTAPTAPTPPTAPQVLFEGGGSVRESNVPVSQQQTNDERLESQARASVARGDGALAKTTQEKPTEGAAKSSPAQGSAQTAPQDSAASAASATAQAGTADASAQAESAQQAQALVADAQGTSPATHGVLYWGSSLLFIAILAGLILRQVLKRRGAHGELTWQDISEVSESDSLRGLTPDEVLAQIAKEERAKPLPPLKPIKPRADGEEQERFEVRI